MVLHDIAPDIAAVPSFDQTAVLSILNKVGRDDRDTMRPLSPLSYQDLHDLLSDEEWAVIVQLRDTNPADLGFFGPFITHEGPPLDLVPLDDQRFTRDGQEKVIPSQYVPPELAKAFRAMQAAIQTEIGVGIFVESGYRSPAQQAITFLTYLNNHHFDAWSTARGVALPGYSQHGDPVHTALDLIDQDGIPTDAEPEKFAHTPAYAWLIEHAQEFGFIQSYPEGNADGIKYEPWHWRYVGLADASAAVDVAA